MNKKSQITLFILLFLVIAITFGFLFYIRNQSRGAMMESESDRILKDFFIQTNFKIYIQNCLDKVTEDGIELIGKQGGYLYNNYPNNDTPLVFRDYPTNQRQVSSGLNFLGPHRSNYCDPITIPDGCLFYFGYNVVPYDDGSTYIAPLLIKRRWVTSNYPYNGVLRSDNTPDQAVGIDSALLNDLCNEDDYKTDFFRVEKIDYSCPISERGTNPITMQHMLTDYIEEHVMQCFFGSDFFSQTLDLDVKPYYDELETNLIIGEDAVNVFFDFPLNVTIGDQSSITRNVRFTADKKVRLKNVYDLVEAIMFMENKDVFFSLDVYDVNVWDVCRGYSYESASDSFLRGEKIECKDMDVEVIDNNAQGIKCDFGNTIYGQSPTDSQIKRCESSSIVKVIDKRSIINGNPFEFVFAIDNRAPVLDLIDREIIADWPNSFYDDYLNTFYGGGSHKASKFFYGLNKLPTHNTFKEPRDDNKSIIIWAGQELRIFPFAIDPDLPIQGRNDIIYKYEGWLSDTPINPFGYYEFIAKYSTHDNFDPTLIDPAIMQHYEDGDLQLQETRPQNVWENSDYYIGNYPDLVPPLTNQDLEDLRRTKPLGAKIPWHSFIHKDANYQTTPKDTGYHILRVYAIDAKDNNLYDYQDIFIHVRCNPGNHLCCRNETDFHFDETWDDPLCEHSFPNGAGKECTYKGCCEFSAPGVIDVSTCEYDVSPYT